MLARAVAERAPVATHAVLARGRGTVADAAVQTADWLVAAASLNALARPKLVDRLEALTADVLDLIHQGALENLGVRPGAPVAVLTQPLLRSFAAHFPVEAELIRASTEAMQLVHEAAAAGAQYGGYAEDGPEEGWTWAYTQGDTSYVPQAHTGVMAATDLIFELTNAMYHLQHGDAEGRAAAGLLDAKQYARRKQELELEAIRRTAMSWLDMKARMGGGADLDQHDAHCFVADYRAVTAGTKTIEELLDDCLQRRHDDGPLKGKTCEEFYMADWEELIKLKTGQ
ncbi:MAG: hypothetical protein QOF65_2911 [Thermoleophilaceae bacterium]|nr:hypothetical protein [Thermoleophilaceae bacterium]